MELENLTMEQLHEGNPALEDQIRQDAVRAERERLSDIDALTLPGYEDLAAEAKANGTSVMDFQKALVAAMRKKGETFLQARQAETAPAAEVEAGDPIEDEARTEEQEIKDNAAAIAEFAKEVQKSGLGMF